VQNALGLLLVVKALGADVKAAAAALAGVRAPKGRGAREVINTADGPFVLLDESYNANPASVRAALAVLKNAMPGPGGRRIAILGDMLEMGTEADTIHASLADDVAQAADLVFACGPAMSHLFANLPHSIRGAHASSSADFAGDIAAAIRAGDVVMVKGSLGSRMALVTGALKARAHQAAAE
jgi:UDP-N-acetylmuramoyl-tripeptide--D-alanyl-D-alanine ligase